MGNLIQATGIPFALDLDCVGLEHLAVSDPKGLALLKELIQAGQVDIVGSSYGQSLANHHLGESCIRQRVEGVRTIMRLLDVRPRLLWEKVESPYGQLPQVLKQLGYHVATQTASGFESVNDYSWVGTDGTEFPTIRLQTVRSGSWVNDAEDIFDEWLLNEQERVEPIPMIAQWIELDGTPESGLEFARVHDGVRHLNEDPTVLAEFLSLRRYIETRPQPGTSSKVSIPLPKPAFTLGKGGDARRRQTYQAEHSLLAAETLVAILSLLLGPIQKGGISPVEELEDSWRWLLSAQHYRFDTLLSTYQATSQRYFEESHYLSDRLTVRYLTLLANEVKAPVGSRVLFNPLGWPVKHAPTINEEPVEVPPLGWITLPEAPFVAESGDQMSPWTLTSLGAVGRLGGLEVHLDGHGHIVQLYTADWPNGAVDPTLPLLSIVGTYMGRSQLFELESMAVDHETGDLTVRYRHPSKGGIRADLHLAAELSALDITLTGGSIPEPDAGMNSGIRAQFGVRESVKKVVLDGLFAIANLDLSEENWRAPESTRARFGGGGPYFAAQKPFLSQTFVDLLAGSGERGLLIVHDGSQQWFSHTGIAENLLLTSDPDDKEAWVDRFRARYRLVPHGDISNLQRYKMAQEFLRPPRLAVKTDAGNRLPIEYSALEFRSNDAVVAALYLERNADLPMGVDHASFEYTGVLRVVELNGSREQPTVQIHLPIAEVTPTNLLGELSDKKLAYEGSELAFDLRPHEISTFHLKPREIPL